MVQATCNQYTDTVTRCCVDWALTVTVNLVHVLWGYTKNPTLLNDLEVLPHNALDNLEVLHGDLSEVR